MGRATSGVFCPCGSRGSTHLLSSGPQGVHMAAGDVNCGTRLAELQGDAAANTPGSTSHHAHLALHGSCHDSQAKGGNLWKQRLALGKPANCVCGRVIGIVVGEGAKVGIL